MSKLDDITYETYSGTRPQHLDGTEKAITELTRNQIKSLVIDTMLEALEKTDDGYKAIAEFRKEVDKW